MRMIPSQRVLVLVRMRMSILHATLTYLREFIPPPRTITRKERILMDNEEAFHQEPRGRDTVIPV